MDPPKDAGVPSWRHEPVYGASEGGTADKTTSGELEEIGREGYIKISCELFPETQMNLKWCMDALRRLVKEANVRVFPPSPLSNPSTALIKPI
jgi:Mitochondrial ribosomal subunit protein